MGYTRRELRKTLAALPLVSLERAQPDPVLYNARITTMNPEHHTASPPRPCFGSTRRLRAVIPPGTCGARVSGSRALAQDPLTVPVEQWLGIKVERTLHGESGCTSRKAPPPKAGLHVTRGHD